MKPSFALDLRSSVITLLHRTALGWTKVGEASLDSPDLGEAMGFMRATALGLSPRGITTKVIIPNSQILYTTVTDPVAEPSARPRRIAATLKGLTPYRLDELAYDWCEAGARLQVAVLAKETLDEAETFARDHRFNPVSFVAVPEAGTYLGEPFFGPSKLSLSLLAKDDAVERDTEPMRLVAREMPPQSAAVRVAALPDVTEPVAAVPAVGYQALSPEAGQSEPDVQKTAPLGDEPEGNQSELAAAAAPPAPAAEPPPAFVRPAAADPDPTGRAKGETPTPLPPKPGIALPPVARTAKDEILGTAAATPPKPPKAEAPEAPMALDVGLDEPVAAGPALRTAQNLPPVSTHSARQVPPVPHDDRLRAIASPQRPAVPRPAEAKPLTASPAMARPTRARLANGAQKPLTKDTALDAAKARATVERGLDTAEGAAARQRRYIIIFLSAVLVLLLAFVVIWASLRLSTNEAKNSAPPKPEQTAHLSTAPAAPPGDTVAAPETTAPTVAAQSTAAQLPSPLDEAAADGQTLDAADPALAQTAPSEPAPVTEVGAQDVVVAAPDTAGQDEIFLASADTPPVSLDPIALPSPELGADTPPVLPTDPPPYVAPVPKNAPATLTPEGALVAQGVLGVAGRPPNLPGARPKSLILGPPMQPVGTLPSAPAAGTVIAQDPSLADKRPRNRPTDLVPVVVAVASAVNPLAPDSRYAKLRPQARPFDLSPAPQAEADGLVLAISPKPQARPADITTGINDAVSVALNQEPAADQPMAQAPAPVLPTKASVAKQATDRNVLKANRVALLAVFGTPSSRYAMIRLASGRVKKVKVGDVVDGGRIAGISADAIQYQKGSRIVTLSLPQG